MINCENGVTKISGKNSEIAGDILCVINGISQVLKNEEKIRRIVMSVGDDELILFSEVIIQGIKEVE